MALRLPQARSSSAPQPSKQQVPVEEIIRVMGNNPLGQALPGIGASIGQAIQAAAQRRKQQQQLAALGKAVGAEEGQFDSLDPTGASLIARSLLEQQKAKESSIQNLQRIREMERLINVPQGSLGSDMESANEVFKNKLAMQRQRDVVKPPPGYAWTQDGGLEPIKGGPVDRKIGQEEAKAGLLRQGAISQANRIISKVDQAMSKVGNLSAGVGSYTKDIPATPAKNLATDLQTIKSNLGFAELQAMRQSSPTGGALGQVAVQELEALQSTLASLDQSQSPDQLRERLKEVRDHYTNWKNAVSQSGQQPQQDVPMTPDEEAAAYLSGL